MRILITGGAGFIGSRLAKRLAGAGASVTVLDNLSSQVHGERAEFSTDLRRVAQCVRGDVRDPEVVRALLHRRDLVVHLAAETGTGQSMYAIEQYEDVNVHGTAVLLDLLVNSPSRTVKKIVVASSRAVYGEGKYRCPHHGVHYPKARSASSLADGRFDPTCPQCGEPLTVLPTTEDTPFSPASFYGLTKQVQEQMVLMFARTLGLAAYALRYQNVFGPGQSLRNPYTGILAVFSNLVRQGKALNVFEDGLESRDFIYVDDVVEATVACVDSAASGVHALNVGSGVRTSVLEIAQAVAAHFQADVPIMVSGDYRLGDVRHNVADISALRDITGFNPRWSFAAGLKEFLTWAEQHDASDAGFDRSIRELRERGLLGSASVS
jgi:dTDP-L-rhamnose 4-epimerase